MWAGDGLDMIQVHYVQAHLLLCGLVPNRPGLVLVCGLVVGDPCFKRWFHSKVLFESYGGLEGVECFVKEYEGDFLKNLFIFRERGREGERAGEKHQRVVASHTPPYWGPGPQPRLVP